MNLKLLAIVFLTAIFLTACGSVAPASPTPDVFAIHTFAAQTVIAELTQTAAANSATPAATATEVGSQPTTTAVPTSIETATPTETATLTPTATFTQTTVPEALPTDEFCDNAIWAADISVQDGTQMSPGQNFEKTWLVKNTGTCTWGEGYHLIYGYDEKMNGQARPLPKIVSPNETVEVTVVFTAPLNAGEYKSYWRMANTAGANFGEFLYVSIVVR